MFPIVSVDQQGPDSGEASSVRHHDICISTVLEYFWFPFRITIKDNRHSQMQNVGATLRCDEAQFFDSGDKRRGNSNPVCLELYI